jgi:hypothetical protein
VNKDREYAMADVIVPGAPQPAAPAPATEPQPAGKKGKKKAKV